MDLGLLILRLALAAILYMHATQKTLGWFSGSGLDRMSEVFHGLGQRPGRHMVRLAAACEVSAAALLTLGLITPLGAAILAGTMTVAGGSQTIAKGTVWNALGGGEYPLVLATLGIVLGFTGPGRWSIDNAIGAPWVTSSNGVPAVTGVIVFVVALLAASPVLLRTRALLRPARPAATPEAAQSAPEGSEG